MTRGYSVTLHPFDERDYLDRVIPVAIGRLAPEALREGLHEDPGVESLVRGLVPRMRAAWLSLRAGDGVPWAGTVHLAAGLRSAWVHPVFYLGDLGLSYWKVEGECPFRLYSRSMAIVAARSPEVGAAAADLREGFAGPRTAGSCILSGDVLLLLRDLEKRPRWFTEPLVATGYDPREVLCAVIEALHYARERHLGLLEVDEMVDTQTRGVMFPEAHLRGAWRGGWNPEVQRRVDKLLSA